MGSIFDVVRNNSSMPVTSIKFEQSFRIHRDVAEFLRRAVYEEDGIAFHSAKTRVLERGSEADPLFDAVWQSAAPIVLLVHDETDSQQENVFEAQICSRVIGPLLYERPEKGVGVVVPHRAQKSLLRQLIIDRTGNEELADSVDTIERFQGNERDVILYSATESDPGYLRSTSQFLLDKRRLTVAMSRAMRKLIVVASQSIFDVLPENEVSLENLLMWRALRDDICTVPLDQLAFGDHTISVFANRPLIG